MNKGMSKLTWLEDPKGSRYQYIREMIDFCEEYSIVEFRDLFNYASRERFEDWFPLLCDGSAYVMVQYIKSLRRKHERETR